MAIHRGEVCFVQLGPTVGRELDAKRRPVVVLSSNNLNALPLVVVVIPGSSWKGKRVHVNEVLVDPSDKNGLSGPTVFQCHQIRAIDHSRFDQPPAGQLQSADLASIEKAVTRSLDLP